MKPKQIIYSEIDKFLSENSQIVVHDEIDLAFAELFDIEFPSKKDTKTHDDLIEFKSALTNNNLKKWGCWFYYPWLNSIVHFPPKAELRALRTSRNRNLITAEEQKTLYSSSVFIAGMSVGSNIVEALVSQGIGGKLVIADMDKIEPSNLNRIRSPFHHVGLLKTDAISRKAWEIDPYLDIVSINEGINEDNLPVIIEENSVDIIVDEIDDLRMKILIRKVAKQSKLPVVMAADDGDNALIDIERYDLDLELKYLNGIIPEDVLDKIINSEFSRPEQGAIIGKYFVGLENVPLRMFKSLTEVGKSLPSWPQLGGAAALSGITIAYIVKKIVLGEKIISGRALISLDEKIDLESKEQTYREETDAFIKMFSENV